MTEPTSTHATAKTPYLHLQLMLHDSTEPILLSFVDFKTELENGDDLGECLHEMGRELLRVLQRSWPPSSKTRVIIGPAPLKLVKDPPAR